MRTIETKAIVTEDGELRVKLPPDVKPGEHNIRLVIDDSESTQQQDQLETFVIGVDAWPEGLSLRREGIYGDRGR